MVCAEFSKPFGRLEGELATTARVARDLVDSGSPKPVTETSWLVRDVVAEAVQTVRRAPSVAIVNRAPPDLPVHLDRGKSTRILSHLIQNAADAIPPHRAGRAVIEASADDAAVRIAVIDDGVGFGPDVATKMKEPLFSSKVKGTGLGLSVADALVRQQGGVLTCESREGQGSTFIMTFPRAMTASACRRTIAIVLSASPPFVIQPATPGGVRPKPRCPGRFWVGVRTLRRKAASSMPSPASAIVNA